MDRHIEVIDAAQNFIATGTVDSLLEQGRILELCQHMELAVSSSWELMMIDNFLGNVFEAAHPVELEAFCDMHPHLELRDIIDRIMSRPGLDADQILRDVWQGIPFML